MGYKHLPEGDESIESFRDGIFRKVRRALGTTAFGINELRMPAGYEGKEHDESQTGHDEVYAILEGSATFTIDGDEVRVAAGDYIRVDPDSTRQIAAGPDGVRLIVVAAKAQPEYDGRPTL